MRRYPWEHFGKRVLMVVVAVCCLTACSAFKPKVDSPSPDSQAPPRTAAPSQATYLGVPCYLHKVRWPEESLSAIARWYTGSTRNANILAQMTPNLKGDDLRPGDVIFIPQELSRRTEPMSRSYARRYGKASPPKTPPRTKTAEPDTNDLPVDDTPPPAPYGPRSFPD
jgi:hypothetical protein